MVNIYVLFIFLGEFLFQGILYTDCSLEDWQSAGHASAIQPLHLLQLLLVFWLHTVNPNRKVELEMSRLRDIIKSICCNTGNSYTYIINKTYIRFMNFKYFNLNELNLNNIYSLLGKGNK